MNISLFDMFSIGIGPSSSHTVGPMCAANAFIVLLKKQNVFDQLTRIKVSLYGSLALTGKGHGTDKAIINGLSGYSPDSVDPESMLPRMNKVIAEKKLNLNNEKIINFNCETDFPFLQKELLPKHTNGMRFQAYKDSELLLSQDYYSIGGGFITTAEKYDQQSYDLQDPPHPFATAKELLNHCVKHNKTIADIMLENELSWRSEDEVKNGIIQIAKTMLGCIESGCQHSGELPGGLHVKRRAPLLYQKLIEKKGVISNFEQSDIMNYLNLFAMAVNEENAAGGRIVTAPTNGAAGIIPAVYRYLQYAYDRITDNDTFIYFLTCAAIGILYKKGASISGAEVGCQGEVGVASSMAAAGITAVLGGTVAQVENAAEIAMEHHLGMTCDPINGLVQIPCIERNAMGSVKAVNASRMALIGDGEHKVSLDKVIRTMRQTGIDMQTIYKETSLGGLAVNFIEC